MHQSRETVELVRSILEHFTYKPEWIFNLREHNGDWWVHISWRPLNSRNPTRRCDVASTWFVPTGDYFTREGLMGLFRHKLYELERHEADEWMVFDGVRKYDPHVDPPIIVDNEVT